MDCARFDRRLDALLEGSCTAAEWQDAEAHADVCPRCRSLLDAMAGQGHAQDAAAEAALADSVLARTSGAAACEAAHDRLADLVDGTLEGLDRELVEGHVARCEACAALATTMTRVGELLPGFAELRVPDDFVRTVIAATSRRPPSPSFDERIAAWLARLAARPRFSLEAAYVCTVLIFVAVGNPVAAFRETSSRGRELAQPRLEQVLADVASGPAALMRDIRTVAGERTAAASVMSSGLGLAARTAASVSSAWRWMSDRLFAPARDAFARLVAWATGLLQSNSSAPTRVDETGGTQGRRRGDGQR